MEKTKEKKKQEAGEVMLEGILVYSITIMLLFLLLAIFSVLFQVWNVQIIANETAARVAQTYRLVDADVVTGYVTEEQIVEVPQYRYLFGNDEELENAAEIKVYGYANERLLKTTYAKRVSEPVIAVDVIQDALARRHIEVRIEAEYAVPFGEVLSFLGVDSTNTYDAIAYAECVDLVDYINTVDYTDNFTSMGWLESKSLEAVDKLVSLFNKITEKFFGY